MKRNKMYIIYAATVLVAVGALVFMAVHLDNKGSDGYPTDSDGPTVNVTDDLNISLPIFSEEVAVVDPAVKAYLGAGAAVSATDIYRIYYDEGDRFDIGVPVKLFYNITGVPEGYTVKSVEFAVAENAELDSPYTAKASGYKAEVDVYNLKTGTKYYYSVSVAFENGAETVVSGSFKTAAGPRLMNVAGVYNMRDIGGWVTEDGTVINQGLLYRGCEIDGAIESTYAITPEGVAVMLNTLGIKTDMDLRNPELTPNASDALGDGVEHIYYAGPMYAEIFTSKKAAEKMRTIFSDLADESNYPIYMHCTYGQDRTGTVCYLLEALLGLSEEDLMKEYQLSAFFHGYQPMDDMNAFVEAFKSQPGATMSEKAEGYLLSIGVTADEIANIRRIHLS